MQPLGAPRRMKSVPLELIDLGDSDLAERWAGKLRVVRKLIALLFSATKKRIHPQEPSDTLCSRSRYQATARRGQALERCVPGGCYPTSSIRTLSNIISLSTSLR
jgi:hypothetical protein